jgi:hypothetical protein
MKISGPANWHQPPNWENMPTTISRQFTMLLVSE